MQLLLQQQHAVAFARAHRAFAADSPCSTSYAIPRRLQRERPARRDAVVVHGGKKDKGARKEGMALEKTLKTARKQLESELMRAGTGLTPESNASLIAKLDEVLASLRAHSVMVEEESSSSSSSSDSSEDEGMPMPRRGGGGATTMAMPPSPLPFASPAAPHPFATPSQGAVPQPAASFPAPQAAAAAAVARPNSTSAAAAGTAASSVITAPTAASANEAVHSASTTPAADPALLDSPVAASSSSSSFQAAEAPRRPPRVMVCTGSKCADRGAATVLEAVALAAPDSVDVVPCKCLGKCRMGPAVRVRPEGMGRAITHTGVTVDGVQDILDAHFATPQLQVDRMGDGSVLVVCEDGSGADRLALKEKGNKVLAGSLC